MNYGKEDQIRAIAILCWTLFARRPLTVRELAEALIVEQDLGEEDLDADSYSSRAFDESMDRADIPEIWDDVYIEDQILRLCGSLVVVRGDDANQPIEDHSIFFRTLLRERVSAKRRAFCLHVTGSYTNCHRLYEIPLLQ